LRSRGTRSAAELAQAGGIDVNVGRLFQLADFGISPYRPENYTLAEISVNEFFCAGVMNFTPRSVGKRLVLQKPRLYGHLTGFGAVSILQTPQSPMAR
jgi:hypothetical protein